MPDFWELETLLGQNDVHPKVQRELLEVQASVHAFVSWVLYVASPQSGNLADPLGYAISRLREHSLREARGVFRKFADLPPSELLMLIDATPQSAYALPVQVDHPLAHAALIGEDDTRRLFAELYADPDRPDVRPQEGYQAVLSSMQPGWTLRLLQLFWPDPEPRLEFQRHVKGWKPPAVEGLDILYQGLMLAVQEYPLPFVRRTVLEFVLPGDEGVAWWEGLTGLCAGFGLRVRYLDQASIEGLTRWVLNPSLEYRSS